MRKINIKKRYIVFVAIFCLVSYVSISLIVVYSVNSEVVEKENEIRNSSDNDKLLAACRQIMANKKILIQENPERVIYNMVYIEFPYDGPSIIPNEITRLDPIRIEVADDIMYIILNSGHNKLGLRAFAEGVEEYGTEKLVEGLWLVSNRYGPPKQ